MIGGPVDMTWMQTSPAVGAGAGAALTKLARESRAAKAVKDDFIVSKGVGEARFGKGWG